MSKKEKDDNFVTLRRISADLEETVETINNLAEQLGAAGKISGNLEILKQCPDWKTKLTAKIVAELTDTMMKMKTSLDCLAKLIGEFSTQLEEGEKSSGTNETDLISFVQHLRTIHHEYSQFLDESDRIFDEIQDGRKPKLDLKKRSLFEETFEIRGIYMRLKNDSRINFK
uniref:Uncharacterized protein n=1 Tax=Panagrolaimus sp. JU765 TaxID=591449 RepID=A0AC34Q3J7_9BILA